MSILFADGTTKLISPDGTEKITFPDSTTVIVKCNGSRIVKMPKERKMTKSRILIK